MTGLPENLPGRLRIKTVSSSDCRAIRQMYGWEGDLKHIKLGFNICLTNTTTLTFSSHQDKNQRNWCTLAGMELVIIRWPTASSPVCCQALCLALMKLWVWGKNSSYRSHWLLLNSYWQTAKSTFLKKKQGRSQSTSLIIHAIGEYRAKTNMTVATLQRPVLVNRWTSCSKVKQ
jgi:hypothetical protein